MSEVPSITELLNGQNAESEEVAETTDAPDVEPTDEKTADEAVADSPSESEEPEKEAKGEKEPGTVPIAALLDEREKRQEMERRLRELESSKEPEKPIDPLVDPEGFQKQLESRLQIQRQQDKFELTRSTMQALKDDYEDMEALFLAEAEKSPYLQNQLRDAANPALLAYTEGQRIAERQKAPEINAQMQKELETLRAELEALKGKPAPAPNLAKAGQSGIQTDPPAEVPSVTELLNSRKQ